MKQNKSKENKRSMSRNVVANLAGRVWSMVSIYIFIPLYIHFLGEETFGLVTFFATLQTVMNLLGLGLSKTLRRVFASGEDTDENKLYKYQMMRSVELVYDGVALLIILICFLGADFIAGKWLNVETLDIKTVAFTIRLMGVSIGLQVLTSMYSGCLFGLEYQVRANAYKIGWAFFKNIGVILLLWLISPDVRLFYSWHIFVDILYLFVLRGSVVGLLKCNIRLKWSIENITNLREIWKFATGLMVISFVYVLNTQLDKAVISKYLSLVALGAYNTAYSLGNLTSVMASAVATAVFSRFTQFQTTGKSKELKESFLFINKAVGLSIIVLGAFIAIYSNEIMLIWTGNTQIVDLTKEAALFIVIGSTFLSLQLIPYEFMLSLGNTKVNNILSISSIPYVLIITPTLIRNMGIFGAAISWCVQMLLSTILYLGYIHSRFIGKKTVRWLMLDTVLPFAASIVLAFISKQFIGVLPITLKITILYAMVSGGISIIIIYSIFDRKFLRLVLEVLKKIVKRGYV